MNHIFLQSKTMQLSNKVKTSSLFQQPRAAVIRMHDIKTSLSNVICCKESYLFAIVRADIGRYAHHYQLCLRKLPFHDHL
jgi:hypothetical protein